MRPFSHNKNSEAGKMHMSSANNNSSDSNNLNHMVRKKQAIKKIRSLLLLIILIPVISFMLYPMANMSPRDLHVGIVNLDKGASFDQGDINLGNKIADKITETGDSDSSTSDSDSSASNADSSTSDSDSSASDADSSTSDADSSTSDADSSTSDSEDSPVVWETFASESAAKKAVKDKEVYGYLVIPKDFSDKQSAQLTAFNTLGTALGKMGTGTNKMSSAVNALSSKLGQLPTAFSNLSTATSKLGSAANGLKNASGAVGDNAGEISSKTGTIDSSTSTMNDSVDNAIASINSSLGILRDSSATEEQKSAAIKDIQDQIDSLDSSVDSGVSAINGDTAAISGKASAISGQASAIGNGLSGIASAENQMSTQFSGMADKMSNVGPGIGAMSNALGKLSSGMNTMSGKMDSKVSDAIDTINSSDAEQSSSETAKLKFVVDQSRNVMISSTLTSAISNLSASSGMQVDINYMNPVKDKLNVLYVAMVCMMMVMFSSMIPGIITGLTIKPSGSKTSRLKTILFQLVLTATIAGCLGLLLPQILEWMLGTTLPISELGVFVAIVTFSYILFIIAAIDLFGKAGIAFPALIMVCGTAVANLPYEFLPYFWQHFIYPWEPLRLIADGFREILYLDGGGWNNFTMNMACMAIIAACFMLIAFFKKDKQKLEEPVV